MLSWIEIATIPKNKTSIESLFAVDVLLTLNKIYPASKLKQPHNTLTVGEDSPLPGGFAKGVGNEFPETPLTK